MKENQVKYAQAQMLIRKPVSEVFQAFIDPELTKHFWFTHGSEKLEVGKMVSWSWEMYNFSTRALATRIEKDSKISVNWFTTEKPTIIEFEFNELSGGNTFVSIKHFGFDKTGDDLVAAIVDSTGGFATVLAGLKAFLEHNIDLNLIADKYPKEIADHII